MYSIINWLLTRKCNLKCEYCGLVHEPKIETYPNLRQLYNDEKDSDYVIKCLEIIKKVSPNCFHIFYGGEPLLFKGLSNVINFCNKESIEYTIITNGTLPDLLEKLYDDCKGKIRGLTCSCDPIDLNRVDDRAKKTLKSFETFKWANEKGIEDIVAEITLDKMNFKFAPEVVKKLNEMNVWASITCYDKPHNDYYDFSVSDNDETFTLYKTPDVLEVFDELQKMPNVHLPKLLNLLYDALPANNRCRVFEFPYENMTIDSDGIPRLCLRIRGYYASERTDFLKTLKERNEKKIERNIKSFQRDYERCCNGCCWTCPMMSKITIEDPKNLRSLLHK